MNTLNRFATLCRPGILDINVYTPGTSIDQAKKQASRSSFIKLASNENPLGCSPQATLAAQQALANLSLLPSGTGSALKHALSQHWAIPSDYITLGNGSDECLRIIPATFVDTNDHVIMSDYNFPTHTIAAKTVGADITTIPTQHFGADTAAMLAAITTKTKMIFLTNPNNPTGTLLDHQTLSDFLSQIPPHILVVVDEAYYEYLPKEASTPNSIALLDRHPNLIITRTFSKIYGLAGLRIGYCLAHPDIGDLLNRVRAPFNTSNVAQAAAEAALADQAFVQQSYRVNQQGQEQFAQAFQSMNLHRISSYGNFVTIDVQREALSVYQALLHEGIIVRPLTNFHLPKHLRITIGLPEQNERVINALIKIFTHGD